MAGGRPVGNSTAVQERVPVPLFSVFCTKFGRALALLGAIYASAACGGGGGGGPTTPPTPTTISHTMRFQDYVSSGRKANSLDFTVRAPDGSTKKLDANQVTFEQKPSGSYCIEAGGSHVKSFGSDQCYSVTQNGSQTYSVLENAPDVESFWSAPNDAATYDRSQHRALADSRVFNNAWLNIVNQGFALGAACVRGSPTIVELGSVPATGGPAAGSGYDLYIREGAPGTTGGEMTLPAPKEIRSIQAAAEEERVHGVYGDYGGYEEEINQCAYPVSYATAALINGAPKN